MQYLLFYAEIIDKNCKNRAYADLGHINGTGSEDNDNMVLLTPNFFAVQALEGLEAAGDE